MILFPAIDLKGGECVRLVRGDMAQATVFNVDPAAQAREFECRGFEWLHVVDLDGAFAGQPMNAAAVENILAAVTMKVQLGGGIRDMKTVAGWLEKGVARVIIGTAAVRGPGFRARGVAAVIPAASRSASTRATDASRSTAGRARPTFPRSISAAASRTPASPRSSTPTSAATASCRASTSPRPSRSPRRSPCR